MGENLPLNSFYLPFTQKYFKSYCLDEQIYFPAENDPLAFL